MREYAIQALMKYGKLTRKEAERKHELNVKEEKAVYCKERK